MDLFDFVRNLGDLIALCLVIWAQWRIGASIMQAAKNRPFWMRAILHLLVGLVCFWLIVGFALSFQTLNRILHASSSLRGLVSGSAYLWAFSVTGAFIVYRLWHFMMNRAPAAEFNPERRAFVNGAGGALAVAPFAIAGFGGLVQRTDFRVREVDIAIPNLPKDLHGLRILQLSDIHLGPFLTERDLARVIDESANLRPHLAVVTGDLISMGGDPLDACLQQIARLRPDSGILACMGNHEIYAGVQRYAAEQGARFGVNFLRGQTRPLRFGSATLNVAGVDYQSINHRKKYLQGAERFVSPDAVNVLLSHNPDVFPVAARQGFDLTISGHTHGGQVAVEILDQNLNIARFLTPFVYGGYSLNRPSGSPASLYVSRGIGTIGLPIRIGAPPEITLLRLTPV